MTQVFKKRANTIALTILFLIVAGASGLIAFLYILDYSPYNTGVASPQIQPVPFSHEHHVGGLGIDCRYCHHYVEQSAFAGIPASEVCMNCHSQIWSTSEMLAPVRESYETGEVIPWRRIYDLPDFTYFNHSIHLHKGIGCETCHGRVDRMPLLAKATDMKMEWCLDCHRNPTPHVRPRDAVTTMGWKVPDDVDPKEYRQSLAAAYDVKSQTDCYTCHR